MEGKINLLERVYSIPDNVSFYGNEPIEVLEKEIAEAKKLGATLVTWDDDSSEYSSSLVFYKERLETDEEFQERLERSKRAEIRRLADMEVSRTKEIAQLKRLKQKYPNE